MNRPFFILLIAILFCFSTSLITDSKSKEFYIHYDDATMSQGSFSIDFITPIEGEILSGNITVKINATALHNLPLLLRWNTDSWIDLTEWYNVTSQFHEYPIDVTCLPSGNITFEAMQDTGHGIIYSSVEVTIEWHRPPILVVCDYYDTNITDYYTNTLETLGYSKGIGYSTWYTFTNGSPSASDLLDYQFVIWFKGGDPSTISLAERNAIQTFLFDSSLHKFLLTGTEIVWRAYQVGYEAWLSTCFGVNGFIADGSNSENILGSVGSPYFGANYSYGGGDGSQMTGGPDWVQTMELSQGLLEFLSSGYDEYAATMSPFVSGIIFSFAFDAISTSVNRTDLMNRTLDYLGLYSPPQMNILVPSEGELKSSPLLLNWDSSSDIHPLDYNPSYKIFVDGQLVIDNWLLETYSLPVSDGNHTIRIVCEDNFGQRGYDSVSVEIDATKPNNEILNYPAGSVLQSGSLLVFNITDIHLDQVVSGWDSDSWIAFPSPYQTYLPTGDGVHIFHVNSSDAAGNWNYTQFTLICDDTPPDISLVNQVNDTSLVSGTTIELEINDTYLSTVMYHWDVNEDSFFSPEYETSLPSGEGIHNLFVNATDTASNQRVV
ncbi:MAG: hypothetical protein ACFFEE_06440, partial [Candidatus Thorarchaeota archaeon]